MKLLWLPRQILGWPLLVIGVIVKVLSAAIIWTGIVLVEGPEAAACFWEWEV